VIGRVKNQTDGKSGSWAFAVTSALEAQYGIKYNNIASLSVQQLIDCTRLTGVGVGGTYAESGLSFVAENGGLAWAANYPFTGDQSQCYFNLTIPSVQTYGYGY
jgi:hypothetical protein